MTHQTILAATITISALFSTLVVAQAQHVNPPPAGDAQALKVRDQHVGQAAGADARQLVRFPDEMRTHTLTNMRDHLLALAQIHDALAKGASDQAAQIAERRLGMSSLQTHGAHDLSGHMPKGMQEIGTTMHQGASRFAIEAQNASATGDLKPALAALARTTEACVACHAGYRLQ